MWTEYKNWTFLRFCRLLLGKLKRLLLGTPAVKSRRNFPAAVSDPIVAELSRKLWMGFSRHAQKDLHQIVRATNVNTQKLLAAWELAKFFAFQSQWHRVLEYIEVVLQVDESFLHRHRAGSLYVEALVAGGRPDEAENHAHHMIDKRAFNDDYRCALSNVIAARGLQHELFAKLDSTRLALLNLSYTQRKLAEIGLIDPSQGFTFANLAVPAAHLSETRRPESVSVLVTVFNAETFLPIALSSILRQTWRNLELVIIDDASTDGSWEIIERFAKKMTRVVCARNKTNDGVYKARNRALSLATGDFVMIHDNHQWSHPQMLQEQVQAMLSEPEIKLTFPAMARVSFDMQYNLRVSQKDARYVYRNCRSYLIKRRDLHRLEGWDEVTAKADEEFTQRVRAIWGDNSLRDIQPSVPMTFRLKRSPFLSSSSEGTTLSRISPAHYEYAKQAEFWRKHILAPAHNAGRGASISRRSAKQPFPIPNTLAPKNWPRNSHYNLIIISDLTLLGGTRRCNEGYTAAAMRLGMRVGLLHWARYDLRLKEDIAKEYRILSYSDNVDILTADDQVSADLVVIHHPPIMKCLPDEVPRICTKMLAILVNQLPGRSCESGDPYYQRNEVEADCLRLFGLAPVWIPISPLVRRILLASGFAPLAKEDWIPPLGRMVTSRHIAKIGRERNPVIGRHSRDHWTKWPEIAAVLRGAYCADSELHVRFLGGAKAARKVVTQWPRNWEELTFDSMTVSDFLEDLDFFVHFTHSSYIEEFGRNIMEAMAAGIPAVVPPRFEEVFGDAACYVEPERVEDFVSALWTAKPAYQEQVDKGLRFVREFASNERIERRLQEAMGGTI